MLPFCACLLAWLQAASLDLSFAYLLLLELAALVLPGCLAIV